MPRQNFCFSDFEQCCQIESGGYRLDTVKTQRNLGLKIHVPAELHTTYPFSASAYALMQQLRPQILEYGIVEFPKLPVNKTNYTLAQRDPSEHSYSSNTYLTDSCQQPHQDTPPYPSGFWLGEPRRYSSTWVISDAGLKEFLDFTSSHRTMPMETIHQHIVRKTLKSGTGILVNRQPGLLLIDNSDAQQLYHARTNLTFNEKDAVAAVAMPRDSQQSVSETPMYAFNEPGLLQLIDTLDSRRGNAHRDKEDQQEVETFLATNKNLF